MTAGQALQLGVDGLVIGALYALVGLGVVIVYRATRILNFAQGGVATTAGYLASILGDRLGLPYVVCLAVAVTAGLAIGGLIGALMTYGFPRAGALEKSVATLGIAFVLTWLNRSLFGDIPQTVPQVFASYIAVAGVVIPGHGIYVIAVALVAIAFAMWLVNRTRLGLAMRALSQDGPIARAYGVSNTLVSVASWSIASGLAALAGVLVASFIQVDQNIMTIISIQSLAALVLGGFGTPIGAIVGGLSLGVASSLAAGYLDPAYKNSFVFAAVLAMLIFRPQGLVGRKEIVVYESGQTAERPDLPHGPFVNRRMAIVGVAGVLLIVALPFIPQPFPLITYSVMFATATVVASLGFLMGYIGEVSLGQGALATVGAYVSAFLLLHYGNLALPIALALSVVAAAIIGAGVGYVTLRLSGLYLAIATLTLTFVVTEFAQRLTTITGGPLGLSVASPFGDDRLANLLGLYYLAAVTFVVVAVFLSLLLRTRLAIYWVATRDVPVAALVNGVHTRRYKVLGFTISSAIAGLGGAVLAILVSHIGPGDYGLNWSFVVVLAVVIGGTGSNLGALGGAAVITFLPAAISQTAVTDLVFGAAIVILMAVAPRGIPGALQVIGTRLARRGGVPLRSSIAMPIE